MPAEAEEIAGAGTAGVDKGGRAAPLCDQSGINTERGAAPIDMSVQIYEPRHDNQAACIDSLDTVARQVRPDRGNLAIGKGNVGDLVAPVRRIDDPAASEKEIRHWSPQLACHAYTRLVRGKSRPVREAGVGPSPKGANVMAASPKAAI